MSARRFLLGVASVLTAVLLQTTVIARVPAPGGTPDLVLVLVVAFSLCEGARSGMLTGFAAGLLADLQSDHELGRLMLMYVVVGYAAGMVKDDSERSTWLPFAVVGVAGLGAMVVYFAEGVLLGDPRTSVGVVGLGELAAVAYDVVLTPFVVPVIGVLVRRVDPDPVRSSTSR